MKLSFYGADQCVTGSCHCLEVNGRRILVDCGLQQGRDEVSNDAFPFAANDIDFVLVTHAHIDHTGRIPMLVKQGFQGRIVATRLTADLMDIMLQDSAHIQESDAEWKNRKAERSGAPRVEPLYTIEDAQRVSQYMTTCEYNQPLDLCEGVRVEFVDAGHLLGSASILVTATEGGITKQIVFSGDIGNVDQPIIRDPTYLTGADYVVMESTYGDRNHTEVWSYTDDLAKIIDETIAKGGNVVIPSFAVGRTQELLYFIRDPTYLTGADYVVMESTYGDRNHTEVWSYTDDLAKIIDETIAKGGNVVIPSFAVGRTQELLYFIREIKDKGMVKSDPDFPVYIDSPLAKKATTIFTGDLRGYLDEAALELVQDGTHMFNFTNLRMTETSEESKMLNMDPTPKVIISASGMCDAGRIRHHLKHNLWRPECTVVFVGYQGEGTLGRTLLEGVKSVKLFGEEIAVHAQIVNFQGLSSHADRNHLLSWIQAIQAPKPQHVFVVHGDREVAPFFAKTIQGLGFTAHAPQYTEVYDLIADKVTEPGYLPERKARTTGGMRASAAYERLVAVGNMLMESIKRSRGRDNKSLARFADQLRQLLEKWES